MRECGKVQSENKTLNIKRKSIVLLDIDNNLYLVKGEEYKN